MRKPYKCWVFPHKFQRLLHLFLHFPPSKQIRFTIKKIKRGAIIISPLFWDGCTVYVNLTIISKKQISPEIPLEICNFRSMYSNTLNFPIRNAITKMSIYGDIIKFFIRSITLSKETAFYKSPTLINSIKNLVLLQIYILIYFPILLLLSTFYSHIPKSNNTAISPQKSFWKNQYFLQLSNILC